MLVKKGERMPIGIYSLAGRMGRGHLPGRRGGGSGWRGGYWAANAALCPLWAPCYTRAADA